MEAEHATAGVSRRRVIAAIAPAMVVPFLGSLIYFVAFAGESWARWTYVMVKVFTLVWPLLATLLILGRSLPRVDPTAAVHRRALPLGALTGLGIVALVIALMQTGLADVILSFAPRIRHKVEQLGVLDHYVAFALLLSLVHSALEEYYWRWFVFGNLNGIVGLPAAVSIASLAFASHHWVIVGQYVSAPWALLGTIAVVAAGTLWCLMYARQKTLAGAWLSHALADLVIFWVGYRLLF